jgi:glucose/arabinose dehydrogenase
MALRICKRRARDGPTVHSRRLAFERLEGRAVPASLPSGFTESVVADGLLNATAIEFAPNGDLWVLEQGGAVKRFRPGSTTADVVGNLSTLGLSSAGERGVLGIAFDPQYSTNKQVYLYYTATSPATHNRISRFMVNDSDAADYYFAGTNTGVPDAGTSGTPTQSVVFDLDNLSSATNHNGGAIHFGPDGKLYVAAGENANPANAQSLNNVLGKILRINSDGSIPTDNPFVASTSGKQQAIWALGLRNPYTFAFQPGTGRMFINDVGQDTWEEIDDGLAGSNYGWPNTEGNDGTPPTGPGTYRGPLYTYSHGSGTFQGEAITGGAFYNPTAQQFPAQFAGEYFFADYVNDWIHVLDVTSGNVTEFATGAPGTVDLRVTSDGSLYYLARNIGQVLRVNYPTVNHPPTISAIADQAMMENGMSSVGFTIGDGETQPTSLLVTAVTDNSVLLPTGALVVVGTGADRTLEITPAAQQAGLANVLVTVGDGTQTASTSFRLIVWSVAEPWHNPQNAYDVDADGGVAANDAVIIINRINGTGSGSLGGPGPASMPPPFIDVSSDNFLSPIDALLVINFINSQAAAGEGEATLAGADVPTRAIDRSSLAELLLAEVTGGAIPRRRLPRSV